MFSPKRDKCIVATAAVENSLHFRIPSNPDTSTSLESTLRQVDVPSQIGGFSATILSKFFRIGAGKCLAHEVLLFGCAMRVLAGTRRSVESVWVFTSRDAPELENDIGILAALI